MRSRTPPPVITATLAGAAAIAGPGVAAPSFDCARAHGAAQALVCSDDALGALDVALAERFSAALDAARETGEPGAVSRLRAMQRGWIKGRDDCWKAPDLRACVEDAYARRDALLAATWMLGPHGAPIFYQCGASPADELVVTVFGSPRPAVRLERGDRVEAAALSPAASGARYEGAFGAMFWSKGAEAMLTLPPEPTVTCRRR